MNFKHLKTVLVVLSSSIAFFIISALAQADIILETAIYVPGDTGGSSIAQFLGARFQLSQATAIDHIGGDLGHTTGLGGNELIFGAIVPLEPSTFPAGLPATLNPSAFTVFPVPVTGDMLVPLSVVLAPGDYGLVFGSGLFGATGSSYMPLINISIPQTTFFGFTSGWVNDTTPVPGRRFVVTGSAVPEPSSMMLLIMGIVAASIRRITKK